MRVVFMGTPQLAATVLEEVLDHHEVAGVFTRPDAVRGRGNKLVASPVKQVAQAHGIEVFCPASMKGQDALETLRSLDPDIVCVSAFGALLPKQILEVPRLGCLNVHTSLLPRWRGAAPIERCILEGDEVTGVCIMRMEEGLDTGDYCRRVEVPIDGAYANELTAVLAREGARALVEAMGLIEAGEAVWVRQADEGVCYAEKIAKGELALDPSEPARLMVAKVHASSAAHPARAQVAGRTLAVERAEAVQDEQGLQLCADLECGQVLFAAKRLFVQAQDGPVELVQLRPDGKKSMDARSFAGGVQGIRVTRPMWGKA